ncbi:phage late control D family protein [Laribacter hongkongensis]|uniref:phage late control D family protein n=1 Tax=Laribacter hongkongensis TaxID=168471 RepID=UPI001EFE5C27|nr:contractile injection system protein, VgrG/Pvc8 family [Laribacter hongkongensis]MCG9084379.1 hypothetical protein [Laribacter hongkongensis]
MKPIFSVKLLPDTDLTSLLQDRLMSIRITDKAGLESDELDISLDDRDGAVALPKKGAELEVSLGYEETGLTRLGRYRIDEVECSGPPQQMTLRGRPADMAGSIKSTRRHAWEDTTLEAVVGDIAARNKLKPVCKVKASIDRLDQVNESDLHFLSRIARQYDATATVKGGQLLVLPRGGQTRSASGKALPVLVISREDIKSWRYSTNSRNAAGGVRAKSHNPKTGKTEEVLVPDPDNPIAPIRTVRHAASSKGAAGSKAKATLDAARRSTATLSFTLPGRADIVAERVASITGLKPGVDGQWPIESVVHAFSQSGWETSVECGAGKDQHKKRAGKKAGKKKVKGDGEVLKPAGKL